MNAAVPPQWTAWYDAWAVKWIAKLSDADDQRQADAGYARPLGNGWFEDCELGAERCAVGKISHLPEIPWTHLFFLVIPIGVAVGLKSCGNTIR